MSVKQEVRAMAEQWVSAFNSHDIEALMSLYDPLANAMTNSSPRINSITAMREINEGAFAIKPAMTFEIEETVATENMGYVFGVFKLTGVNPVDSSVIADAGRALVIFKKDDEGKWKLVLDMDNRPPDVKVGLVAVRRAHLRLRKLHNGPH